MNKQFIEKLTEYLDFECNEYGISYNYSHCKDSEHVEVTLKEEHGDKTAIVIFEDELDEGHLMIKESEDSFYPTKPYDYSIKYFWILVSPQLWPD